MRTYTNHNHKSFAVISAQWCDESLVFMGFKVIGRADTKEEADAMLTENMTHISRMKVVAPGASEGFSKPGEKWRMASVIAGE